MLFCKLIGLPRLNGVSTLYSFDAILLEGNLEFIIEWFLELILEWILEWILEFIFDWIFDWILEIILEVAFECILEEVLLFDYLTYLDYMGVIIMRLAIYIGLALLGYAGSILLGNVVVNI